MRKRFFAAAVFSFAAAVVLTVSALAADFSDTQSHWAKIPVQRWSGYGVLDGYSGNVFRPGNNIRRGELFKVVDSVMKYRKMADNPFADLWSSDWYYAPTLRLVSAGIINGANGQVYAQDYITREQAFAILARAFRIPSFEAGINSFSDAGDVSYWAKGEVGGLARAGFIQGYGGKLNPKSFITRAETVQLLDNIIKGYIYEKGTYTDDIQGLTLINSGGVTLRDMVVIGDVHITPGVASGDVILENVIVNGDLYINGGGVNSIRIRGNSRINRIYANVDSVNGPVRISMSSPAETELIYIESGSDYVIIEGTVARVEVGGDTLVLFDNATIAEAYVMEEFGRIQVNENARVASMFCLAVRSRAYVSGTVDKINIYRAASGTQIETFKTSSITEVETWADDVNIFGGGKISFAFVEQGKNVRFTVPGTIISVSKDAERVITGDGKNDYIDPGDTGIAGQEGLTNALNIVSVTILDATRIAVDFSKDPDPIKGISSRNYLLSGDAKGFAKDGKSYPDFVEITQNRAVLTFTGATFWSMSPNLTAIITVSGFTAKDGSPIGVNSGMYRVPSDDATLKSGDLSGIPITGTWDGAAIGDGGSPLKVTIPIRLAENADLSFSKGNSASTIRFLKVGSTNAAPTTEAQYSLTDLKGLSLKDGDKIYIQVTAPNMKTVRYYKLTISIVSTPVLDSVTYTQNKITFNLSNLDEETHAWLEDLSDSSNTGALLEIKRTATDGTGIAEIDLTNPDHRSLLADTLNESSQIATGKIVDGTVIAETKRLLGKFGDVSTTKPENLFFTTQSGVRVVGVTPNAVFISEVKSKISGAVTMDILQADSSGVLNLGRSDVENVRLQRLIGMRIEAITDLGSPIFLTGFNIDLTEGSIRMSDYSELTGVVMRIGSFDLDSSRYNSSNGRLTKKGLEDISRMTVGTYNITAQKPSTLVPTRLETLDVNTALNAYEAKFIEADQVLIKTTATATLPVLTSRFLVAPDDAAVDYGTNLTLDSPFQAGKTTIRTDTKNVKVGYNDSGASLYLVTQRSISRSIIVRNWVYEQVRFDLAANQGTYTVKSQTSYTDTKCILNYITVKTPVSGGPSINLIEIDGEFYEIPLNNSGDPNETLLLILPSLLDNDLITINRSGQLSGIEIKNSTTILRKIEIVPADCDQTRFTVMGGNKNSQLVLSTKGSSTYSAIIEVTGGAVDISDTKLIGNVIVIGRSAYVKINPLQEVEVSNTGVEIDLPSFDTAPKVIRTTGTSDATINGIKLSGNGATAQFSAREKMLIGGTYNAMVTVESLAAVENIQLLPAASQATINLKRNGVTVDLTQLGYASRPVVEYGAANISVKFIINTRTGTDFKPFGFFAADDAIYYTPIDISDPNPENWKKTDLYIFRNLTSYPTTASISGNIVSIPGTSGMRITAYSYYTA